MRIEYITIRLRMESHRVHLLRIFHNSPFGGHCGVSKTYFRIKDIAYRPGIFRDVKRWVVGSVRCQRRKLPRDKRQGFLHNPINEAPNHSVSIDISVPFTKSSSGFEYNLVMVDHFTRWVECVPLRNIKACWWLLSAVGNPVYSSVQIFEWSRNSSHVSITQSIVFQGWYFKELHHCVSSSDQRSRLEIHSIHLCQLVFVYTTKPERLGLPHSSKVFSVFLMFGRRPRNPFELLLTPPAKLHEENCKNTGQRAWSCSATETCSSVQF